MFGYPKSLNSAYSKFEFRPTESFWYMGWGMGLRKLWRRAS